MIVIELSQVLENKLLKRIEILFLAKMREKVIPK